MIICRLALVSLLLTASVMPVASCRSSVNNSAAINYARKYGLIESSQYQELVERAVILANVVLEDKQPIRLGITWNPSGLYPRFAFRADKKLNGFKTELDQRGDLCTYVNARQVPVYVIDDDRLGDNENMFVPDGETCIFVNARRIVGVLDQFYLSQQTQVAQYSDYERASVFALMMLHEIGHLNFGDSGSYNSPGGFNETDLGPQDISIISLPSTDIKDKEIRADRYAVEEVQKGLAAEDWRPFLSLGSGRTSIANHLVFSINIAVNSFDYMNDPWGYLNNEPQLQLLTSRGYTHLNLNLRLLIMLEQLEPDGIRRADLRRLLLH